MEDKTVLLIQRCYHSRGVSRSSYRTVVMDKDTGVVKAQGLGLFIASVFLAGEMAGGGVLALASAMVFTGPAGLAFIVFFALNTGFVGTRLGLCWVMLEERYPELREQVWSYNITYSLQFIWNTWDCILSLRNNFLE